MEDFTYYVGAERTESKGAAHIEMSAVQPKQNFDVIEAISLDGEQMEKERVSSLSPQNYFTTE